MQVLLFLKCYTLILPMLYQRKFSEHKGHPLHQTAVETFFQEVTGLECVY